MPEVVVLRTEEVPGPLLVAVRALMDDAFGDRFDDDDWEHGLGGWHVLACDGTDVVAHAAVVGRRIAVADRWFDCGYVENVATAPRRQRQGLGRLVMAAAGDLVVEHHELGCLSTSSWGFYERLGWERWRGPSYAGEERTADEDDGIMVLRFGPSAEVDPASPIRCEPRAGDDW